MIARGVDNLIYRWYIFRWPLIILPLIVTCCCSVGFLRLNELRIDDPAFVFTPSDARLDVYTMRI